MFGFEELYQSRKEKKEILRKYTAKCISGTANVY